MATVFSRWWFKKSFSVLKSFSIFSRLYTYKRLYNKKKNKKQALLKTECNFHTYKEYDWNIHFPSVYKEIAKCIQAFKNI